MATKSTSKKPNGIKNGAKSRKTDKETKATLRHKYKVELMRNCMIYGKDYDQSKAYFKSHGEELGKTSFTDLRNEVREAKNIQDWFSKEALNVMEEDHMLSVERIRMMEDRLIQEFEQVSATNFYKYINQGTEAQELIRNKSHDAQLLLRIIAQFQSLQETKTKMFSATPLVQEVMEIKRRQEQEESIITQPAKTEKEIKN